MTFAQHIGRKIYHWIRSSCLSILLPLLSPNGWNWVYWGGFCFAFHCPFVSRTGMSMGRIHA